MDVSSESVPRKDLLSEKVSSLPSVQRSYTSEFSAVSELSEGVGIQGKKTGTCSSAATRIVLAKDARRAVAVDTAAAELVS
jgi:hypothetical protein